MEDVRQNYKWIKELGRGTYGVVHEVVNIKANERCAIKVMNKEKLNNRQDDDCNFVKQELQALEELVHPHIVRVIDLC